MSVTNDIWPDFDSVLLQDRPEVHRRYVGAEPFPHLVLDNLFPTEQLEAVSRDFERTPAPSWRYIRSGLQSRQVSQPGSPLPPAVQNYFNIINSGPFIRFLTDVTGIADLIPDPALYGGGMHQVYGGGTFEVHIDFEQHPHTLLRNRLAVITYLNEDWAEDDGGELELWRLKPRECAASVRPIFGRTVIMGQSRSAAHGHLRPIREGRTRRSVTAYFYTNGVLPIIASDLLPTAYVQRRGQSFRQTAELVARLIVPPLLLGGIRILAKRAQSVARQHR